MKKNSTIFEKIVKVGIVNNQFRCDIFMKYFLIEIKPKIIIWHKEPTFLTKIVLHKLAKKCSFECLTKEFKTKSTYWDCISNNR